MDSKALGLLEEMGMFDVILLSVHFCLLEDGSSKRDLVPE